jgi:hypothetical protein
VERPKRGFAFGFEVALEELGGRSKNQANNSTFDIDL